MKSRDVKTWRRAPVLLAVCVLFALSAAAEPECDCTKIWIKTDSGTHSWLVGESWDPEGVPGAGDTACILADGFYKIRVDSPVTVSGLKLDVTNGTVKLKIDDTDFTLDGHGHIAGDTKFKVNDGAVLRTNGGGDLEVESMLVIEGGTVEVDVDLYGHLNWWGESSITGTLVTYPGSLIEVEDPQADAHLTVTAGFDNNGDVVFNDTINQSLEVLSGSLVNTATGSISTRMITESVIEPPELRGTFVNHGLVDVNGLGLRLVGDGSEQENGVDGRIQTSGAELEIDLVGGVTEVVSNFTNRGSIMVAGGGTIRVRGTSNATEAVSNFTNRGTIMVAGGGTIRVRGTAGERRPSMGFVNHGTITVEAVTETLGLLDMEGVIFQPENGTIDGAGDMLMLDSQVSGTTRYVNQLNLTVAQSSFDASITLANTGSLNFQGSSTVSGPMSNEASGLMTVEGSDDHGAAVVQFEDGLDNDGGILLGNSGVQPETVHLTIASGALALGPTGTLGLAAGADGDRRITGELVNQGTVTVSGADLTLDGGSRSHVNDGTITVNGSEFEIFLDDVTEALSNFTNRGTTMVAGGGTIRVRGSTRKSLSGTFSNAGTMDIADGAAVAMESVGFENQASGVVGGSGEIDVSQATSSLFDGHLSPGSSAGILSVAGNLEAGPNASLSIEIGGETPGANHDRLDVSGAMAGDGSLFVTLIDSYHPVGGERYQVLAFASLSGWFNLTMMPALQHLLFWNFTTEPNGVWLEVFCEGTQLSVDLVPDRDPASIGYELIYRAVVSNHSMVEATDIVVSDALPSEVIFRPDLSSPECVLIGSTVECSIATLPAMSSWEGLIAVEPIVAGTIVNTASVKAWECDVDVADNQAMATIEAVAAEPCDANFDLNIDSDDVVPAVNHIFGEAADGNPDCRPGNGINADDLSAIIEASQ